MDMTVFLEDRQAHKQVLSVLERWLDTFQSTILSRTAWNRNNAHTYLGFATAKDEMVGRFLMKKSDEEIESE